jgi:hypothetical protein
MRHDISEFSIITGDCRYVPCHFITVVGTNYTLHYTVINLIPSLSASRLGSTEYLISSINDTCDDKLVHAIEVHSTAEDVSLLINNKTKHAFTNNGKDKWILHLSDLQKNKAVALDKLDFSIVTTSKTLTTSTTSITSSKSATVSTTPTIQEQLSAEPLALDTLDAVVPESLALDTTTLDVVETIIDVKREVFYHCFGLASIKLSVW